MREEDPLGERALDRFAAGNRAAQQNLLASLGYLVRVSGSRLTLSVSTSCASLTGGPETCLTRHDTPGHGWRRSVVPGRGRTLPSDGGLVQTHAFTRGKCAHGE